MPMGNSIIYSTFIASSYLLVMFLVTIVFHPHIIVPTYFTQSQDPVCVAKQEDFPHIQVII
jgi:hypothetical protein